MTRLLKTLLLLAFAHSAFGLARVPVNCNVGAQQVTVAAIPSTTLAPRSVPGATITVYVTSSAQLATALYTSGATVTGTIGQYVNVAFAASTAPGGTAATGTLALTGSNTIAPNATITIVSPGGYEAAPSTAVIKSGTATVTGGPLTIQVNATIGSPAKATIYSDNNLTALANPFTADSFASGFFFAADGNYDVSCTGAAPLPYTFGAVVANDAYFTFPGAPSYSTGAVPVLEKDILGYPIYASYFGAVCDGATDDTAAIKDAVSVCTATGGHLMFPRTGHACGITASIDVGSPGSSISCNIDGVWPGQPGLTALSGGTWETYTSGFDSGSHSYELSIGGAGGTACTALAYVSIENMDELGNGYVDTPLLNRCGQEQTGFHNVLVDGCNYACIETGPAAQNSNYDNLNLFPNANAYGIIDGSYARVSFENMTIDGAEASGGLSSKAAILVYNGSAPYISNLHVEEMAIGVEVNGAGSSAVIDRIDSGPNVAGAAVQIDATTHGADIRNITGSNGESGFGLVKDSLNYSGQTISGFNMGWYLSYKDAGSSYPVLMTSYPGVPWILPNGITLSTGTLSLNGPIAFFNQEQMGTTGNSLYVASQTGSPLGVQFQSSATTGWGTVAGGGLDCSGGGTGGDVSSGGCVAGAVSPSAGSYQTTATSTEAAGWFGQDGTWCAFARTGLTPSTNYTASVLAGNCPLGVSGAAVLVGNSLPFEPTGIISTTGTKFTVSGCSATTTVGGPEAGSFVVGSGASPCTFVLTINGATGMTAPNGWNCWGVDQTSGIALIQSASSTGTCSLKGNASTSDIIRWGVLRGY